MSCLRQIHANVSNGTATMFCIVARQNDVVRSFPKKIPGKIKQGSPNSKVAAFPYAASCCCFKLVSLRYWKNTTPAARIPMKFTASANTNTP